MKHSVLKTTRSGLSLVPASEEEHIRYCTRAALLTHQKEMNGSEALPDIYQFLFRPLNGTLLSELRSTVTRLLNTREPRLTVTDVQVSRATLQSSTLQISIEYRIKKNNKVDTCRVAL